VIANYSEIKTREDLTSGSMDTTLMLKLGKILMYVVSGLITLGFIWDLCVFVRKYARKQRIELKNTSKYLIFLIRSFRGGGGGGVVVGEWYRPRTKLSLKNLNSRFGIESI
jgi:hypothetical protein